MDPSYRRASQRHESTRATRPPPSSLESALRISARVASSALTRTERPYVTGRCRWCTLLARQVLPATVGDEDREDVFDGPPVIGARSPGTVRGWQMRSNEGPLPGSRDESCPYKQVTRIPQLLREPSLAIPYRRRIAR